MTLPLRVPDYLPDDLRVRNPDEDDVPDSEWDDWDDDDDDDEAGDDDEDEEEWDATDFDPAAVP